VKTKTKRRRPAKRRMERPAKPAIERRWLRNGELAAYFGVSKMTVWRWKRDAATNNFPRASLINDIEFNDVREVDAWMAAQRDVAA
jgi:predicted DNA-binding transcriptional regulator AlpA